MYAIVDIAGKQFKVSPDQYIYAPSLAGDAGASVELDNVLLMGNGDNVQVGSPAVSGARVAATIVEHVKDDKVIIFKKKRRKGYKKKQGHRQGYTKLMIDEILTDGQKASKKSEAQPKAEASKQPEATTSNVAHELPASEPMTPAPVQAATEKDDLKKISGIGPVFEKELNRLGVHTYQDLINLSSEEIDRIDEEIVGADRGMIEDQWIPQAKELNQQ